MLLEISESVAQRLKALAEAQNRSVSEVIEGLLDTPEPLLPQEDEEGLPPRGTAARLLYENERINARSGKTDIAEHSREILNTDFVEYLKSRHDADE
jgi:hypothetical protein